MRRNHRTALAWAALLAATLVCVDSPIATAAGTLTINAGGSLSLTGANFADYLINNSGLLYTTASPGANANFSGIINNESTFSLVHTLSLVGNMTLNGSGTTTLNNGIISALFGTRRLVNNSLISGMGNIGGGTSLDLTNNGTISASAGLLTIQQQSTNIIDNFGLLQANGGTLNLGNSSINNHLLIQAAANSVVTSDSNSRITGGTVAALSGGTLNLGGTLTNVNLAGLVLSKTLLLSNVTSSGTLLLSTPVGPFSGSSISVQGSLNHSGEIVIAADAGLWGVPEPGTLTSNAALAGATTVVLAGGAIGGLTIWVPVYGTGSIGGSTTNRSLISTSSTGQLSMTSSSASTNFGTLRADGGTLTINTTLTNHGIVEAINNGTTYAGGTITGGSYFAATGGKLFLSGTLTNAAISNLGGSVSLSGGRVSNATLSGSITVTGKPVLSQINNSGYLHFVNDYDNTGTSWNNTGTISFAQGVWLTLFGDAVFPAGGTAIFRGNVVIPSSAVFPGVLRNGGHLRAISGYTDVYAPFHNSGTVTIQAGATIHLDDSDVTLAMRNSGLIDVDGGRLELEEELYNDGGTVRAINGGVISLSFAGEISNFTSSGTISITNGALLQTSGGSYSNFILKGIVSNGNTFASGELTTTGHFTIPFGKTLNAAGILSNNFQLDVQGTLSAQNATHSGTGTITLGTTSFPGTITSQSSSFSNFSLIRGNGIISGIRNHGTITASPAKNLVIFGTNFGLIDTAGGTLTLSTLTNTSGLISAAQTGSRVTGNITGGTVTINDNARADISATSATLSATTFSTLTLSDSSSINAYADSTSLIRPFHSSASVLLTNATLSGPITFASINTLLFSGVIDIATPIDFPLLVNLRGNSTFRGGGTVNLGGSDSVTGTFRLQVDTPIRGTGTIAVSQLINNHSITATSASLRVTSSGGINNGTMSSAGGNLIIGGSFSNDQRLIHAAQGGTLSLESAAAITGGFLQAVGSVITAQTSSSPALISNATVSALSGSRATLARLTNSAVLSDAASTVTLASSLLTDVILAGNFLAAGSSTFAGIITNHSSLMNASTIILGAGSTLKNHGNFSDNFFSSLVLNAGSSIINEGPALLKRITVSGNATFGGASGLTLNDATVGGGGPLTNISQLRGSGTLTVPLLNAGTLTPTGSLLASNITNSGLISLSSGSISLSGRIDNTAGHIALNSPQLPFSGSGTITGGTVNLATASTVSLGAVTYHNITFAGTTLVDPASAKWADEITILGNPTMRYAFSSLTLTGAVTLRGTGTLSLTSQFPHTTSISSTVSLINNLIINGNGSVSGQPLVNAGLIEATSAPGLVVSSFSNTTPHTGTFRASGASLTLLGNHAGGTYEAVNNSILSVSGTITSGTFLSTAGGSITLRNSGKLINPILGTNLYVAGSPPAGILEGNIVTNHLLSIGANTSLIGGTSLSGMGTLVLAATLFSPTPPAAGSGPIASSMLITGQGTLSIPQFHNSGSIIPTSTSNTITIFSSTLTNTGLMRADKGAIFFSQSLVLNSGIIEAPNNGRIQLFNATISGATPIAIAGTLTMTGSSVITSPLAITNAFLSLTSTTGTALATIEGSGTLTASSNAKVVSDSFRANVLDLRAGADYTIRPISSPSASQVNSLLLATNSANAFTARLDIANHFLILQSDPTLPGDHDTKRSFLQSALLQGFNAGNWLGLGITSSTVAADQSATGSHSTALALYDNALLNLPTIGGIPASSSSLFITTALIGDIDFDQSVGQSDFNLVARNWLTPQSTWTNGDLNYDGTVDLRDALLVVANAQSPLDFSKAPADLVAQLNPVPEPATAALLLPVTLLLRRKNRTARS